MRLLKAAAVFAAGAIVIVGGAATASAATTPPSPPAITILGPVVHYADASGGQVAGSPQAHCEEHFWSRIDSSQYVFIWDGHTWFRDGPGGTMTGTVTVSSTISATITAGATISVNELVADASVTVSASVTGSTSITIGHTYSHNVTAGKYGNLQYGSWGYNLRWSSWERHPDCSLTETGSGGGRVPTVAIGWNYFEN